jgi:hypothetical protein
MLTANLRADVILEGGVAVSLSLYWFTIPMEEKEGGRIILKIGENIKKGCNGNIPIHPF